MKVAGLSADIARERDRSINDKRSVVSRMSSGGMSSQIELPAMRADANSDLCTRFEDQERVSGVHKR